MDTMETMDTIALGAAGDAGGRCGGEGAWGREARRARELAAERGIRLDEGALVYDDVRDLQRLQYRLKRDRRG